jgi:cytosine/adenosine deaminase-related metal-dependent hydrolase
MTTLLLKNAHAIATFDDDGNELRNAFVFVRDGVIKTIGSSEDAPDTADEVIDASRCIVIPGLVNTHHHMYQTLTRAIPSVQDAELFTWLKGLYPIWARMTPDMIHTSALTAMAELLLSGCTTSSDHLYLYPNGAKLDDTISARSNRHAFTPCAAMSVGESAGGLHLIQWSKTVASSMIHNASWSSFTTRIVPYSRRPRACSPFS